MADARQLGKLFWILTEEFLEVSKTMRCFPPGLIPSFIAKDTTVLVTELVLLLGLIRSVIRLVGLTSQCLYVYYVLVCAT